MTFSVTVSGSFDGDKGNQAYGRLRRDVARAARRFKASVGKHGSVSANSYANPPGKTDDLMAASFDVELERSAEDDAEDLDGSEE